MLLSWQQESDGCRATSSARSIAHETALAIRAWSAKCSTSLGCHQLDISSCLKPTQSSMSNAYVVSYGSC